MLTLIFLAFVVVIAGGNAYAGNIQPKEPSAGYRIRNPSGCPQPERVSPNPDSEGVTTLVLCKQPVEAKELPTKKEAPKKSAPPVPETAKALNPTKKAAPDPSELAEKAGQ